MKGRRIEWPEELLPIEREKGMEPGDYAGPWRGEMWLLRAPNGDWGSLFRQHTITEHEDRTITVSPSIQFLTGARWHGYLERGVWRQV
jgi:hypothetical protein